MPRYFAQNLVDEGEPASPSPEPLTGLRPLNREPWTAVMRGQDRLVATSRRVLGEIHVGQSTSEWRHGGGGNTPAPGGNVVMGHMRFRLTPGCFPRVAILHLPSGGVGGISTDDSVEGREGTIRIASTWVPNTGSTLNATEDISLALASDVDGGISNSAGRSWQELQLTERAILPPVDLTDESALNSFSVGQDVTLEIRQIGAPRVVDLVVFEEPYGVSFEADDPNWTSHVYAQGLPDSTSGAAGQRPMVRRSETSPDGNPRGGGRHTLDVSWSQGELLGPTLISWTAYEEADQGVQQDAQGPGLAVATSTFTSLMDGVSTAYNADAPGWSVSVGGHGRLWRGNSAHALGSADVACSVPVRVRAYLVSGANYGVPGSGGSILRLHTNEWSFVELRQAAETEGWVEAYGHLLVGLNGDDFVVAQIFATCGQFVTLHALEIQVEH